MRITAVLTLALAAACSSAPSRPMTEGERLYRAKCTSCHKIYQPSDRSNWPAVLDKMEALKKVHLNPEDRAEILTYLQGHP